MVAGVALGVGAWLPAQAAPLSLGSEPLFLATGSKPNILFVIDDSGSMDWEILTTSSNDGLYLNSQPDGTGSLCMFPTFGNSSCPSGNKFSVPRINDQSSGLYGLCPSLLEAGGEIYYGFEFLTRTFYSGVNQRFPNDLCFGANDFDFPSHPQSNLLCLDSCRTAHRQDWRFRNATFNKLYYDPNVTYVPWSGTNSSGATFGNINVTSAMDNPFLASTTERIDLTRMSTRPTWQGDGILDNVGFRYYTFTDDGDGIFENGEETEFLIRNQPSSDQQNFANWFSYYRSREYVAKAAFGKLIARASNVNMGLVSLHNLVKGFPNINQASNRVGTNVELKLMNADPTTGNKKALLDALYKIHSEGETPLRTNLDKAGKYLECVAGGHFTSCPAAPVAEGGSCQQNFTVLMTDGYYNGSFSSLGNVDGDNSSAFDGGAHADLRANTLADVAMQYYERDLSDNPDNVPPKANVDEAEHQHMVTYSVAFGVSGGLTAMPPNRLGAFVWPNPQGGGVAGKRAKIDDLRHAAYNGRGQFLSAQNPLGLAEALEQALGDIGTRVGTAAAVSLNTQSLSSTTAFYQAKFDSSDWSGQLLSFPINPDGSIAAQKWDAQEQLRQSHSTFDLRKIITFRSDNTSPSPKGGIAFRFSNLSPQQQAFLNDDPTTLLLDNDGEGAARLNYLRGDNTHEGVGNLYRARTTRVGVHSKLGDIAHSTPFFVGPPAFNYPDSLHSKPYSAFRKEHKETNPRRNVVYVGANDGMLHGFAGEDGREVLAYVPEMLFPALSGLTNPGYVHRYYVDGSPTVGDAFVNGDWKTVLVSNLRGGHQGIFALNVTDPTLFDSEANAANIAMWEFTDADDPDIGFVYGQPSIVRMANGKWAAIFGNGYNNSVNDGTASTSGHAVLYILFLDGGDPNTSDPRWQAGEFIKISTKAGSVDTPNGLAEPAPMDADGDSSVDFIYAGDLQGNMWKFDVRSTDPAQWKVAFQTGSGESAVPVPLFRACLDTATPCEKPQPITTAPQVGSHPKGEPGFMLYFGTGKYIEASDNTGVDQTTQTFYGIWDKSEATLTAFNRSHLLTQEITEEVTQEVDTDGDSVNDKTYVLRVSTANKIKYHTADTLPSTNPLTTHLGWKMDLINTQLNTNTDNFGERVVSNAVLRSGPHIIFTTLIPESDPCKFGGKTFIMELYASDGGRLSQAPFDLNGDKNFDKEDYVGARAGSGTLTELPPSGKLSEVGITSTPAILSVKETEIKFAAGSKGTIETTTENPGAAATGRQSWRQLR